MTVMTESEVLSAPVQEQAKAPEADIQKAVTPSVARVLYSSVDTNFFNPEEKMTTSDHRESLKNKTENTINYDAISHVSADSRAAFWDNKTRDGTGPQTFAQQNKIWNSEVAAWIKSNTVGNDAVLTQRKAALESLGFHLDDPARWEEKEYEFTDFHTNQNEHISLVEDVEDFRRTYFKGRNSVEPFVAKLADGCRPAPDQPVDLTLLESRLNSVKDLFSLFGTENASDQIVRDYVYSYGALSQNNNRKADVEIVANEQIALDLQTPQLTEGFKALWAKQSDIAAGRSTTYPEAPASTQQEKPVNEKELKKKFEQAKNEALEKERVEYLRREYLTILQHARKDSLTPEQLALELAKIPDHDKGLIKDLATPAELQKVLQLIELPPEKIEEIMEHEKAHYDEALRHDRHPAFEVQLSRNPDGTLNVHAATTFDTFASGEEHMQKDVLSAPGLAYLSPEDMHALHLDHECVEDALAVVENPAVKEKIEELIPHGDESDKKRHRNSIHMTTAITIQMEKAQIAEHFSPETTSEIPPSPEIPDAQLSAEEMFKAYIKAFAYTSPDPEAFKQFVYNDPDVQKALAQFQTEGRFSTAFLVLKRKLEEATQGAGFTINQETHLLNLLPQKSDSDTFAILPYANGRLGILESNPESIIRTPDGKLHVKLLDIHASQEVYAPLQSLIRTDLAFLQAFSDHPLADTAEFNPEIYSQALIISKPSPEADASSPNP